MRVPQEFRFFTSLGQEIEWKDRVAERQTTLGDAAVQGGLSTAFGVPVKGVLQIFSRMRTEKEIRPPKHQTLF